jgi:hypothetical protein
MRKIVFAMLVCFLPVFAVAQANEFTIGGGAQVSFNTTSNVGVGAAVQGSYARRLAHVPFLSLYAELPITAGFNISSKLPQQVATADYNSLFITPGIKLKFAPISPVSPFVVAGGGWARYRQKATSTSPEATNTTDVFDYGAGLDFKVAPFFGFKTEVRDYFTGPLRFNTGLATLTNSQRQHNIVAIFGLAFRF